MAAEGGVGATGLAVGDGHRVALEALDGDETAEQVEVCQHGVSSRLGGAAGRCDVLAGGQGLNLQHRGVAGVEYLVENRVDLVLNGLHCGLNLVQRLRRGRVRGDGADGRVDLAHDVVERALHLALDGADVVLNGLDQGRRGAVGLCTEQSAQVEDIGVEQLSGGAVVELRNGRPKRADVEREQARCLSRRDVQAVRRGRLHTVEAGRDGLLQAELGRKGIDESAARQRGGRDRRRLGVDRRQRVVDGVAGHTDQVDGEVLRHARQRDRQVEGDAQHVGRGHALVIRGGRVCRCPGRCCCGQRKTASHGEREHSCAAAPKRNCHCPLPPQRRANLGEHYRMYSVSNRVFCSPIALDNDGLDSRLRPDFFANSA